MKLYEQLPAILAGTALTSALVITLPPTATALTGREVNDIAREITVLIVGERGRGSGFIIARNDNTYSVLTNYHVVDKEDKYIVVTADKEPHAVEPSRIQPLPGVDLAVVEFTSDKDYQVAQLGTAKTSEGQDIFVSGWPGGLGALTRQFTDGRISGYVPPSWGYEMVYTNVTRAGMSGGPVLDAGGRVVGVHGIGTTEDPTELINEGVSPEVAQRLAGQIKLGFNLAIPISTFLQLAPQAGIYLNAQVDNSPAPELGAVYTAEEPDERDTIDDINQTLDTLNQGIDTIRRICGLFGC